MIVVKIEIWPFGSESKKREIGKVIIINDGTGNNIIGNYKVQIEDKIAEIKNHHREESVYKLLLKSLKAIYEVETNETKR